MGGILLRLAFNAFLHTFEDKGRIQINRTFHHREHPHQSDFLLGNDDVVSSKLMTITFSMFTIVSIIFS